MVDVHSGHRLIANGARPPRRGARMTGPADPGGIVHLVFVLRRRPDAPALPGHAYWMATPPGRRSFLSRSEFARIYGAAPEELERVAAFARRQGMTVSEASAARRCVIASASVEAVNRTFGVALNNYEAAAETYRGFEGDAYLPADIADLVTGVLGLDNRRIGRHAAPPSPFGAVAPLSPIQVAKFYNFPTSGEGLKSASGQTIGILEFGGGYSASDMISYWGSLGVSPLPTVVSIPASVPYAGSSQNPDGADGEVALDVQVAGAVAPGATIVIYFGTGFSDFPSVPDELGWYKLVSGAIYDTVNNPTVLSISWGAPEQEWGTNIGLLTTLFEDAANMGVTVFASSGDYGASGYSPSDPRLDTAAHVHYPASDPWVTGCGGTIVLTGSPSTVQNTWNDELYQGGATGGGVSSYFNFTNPTYTPNDYPWPYQTSANIQINGQAPAGPINGQVPNGRGVPDVAGNASTFTGYDIIVYSEKASALYAADDQSPIPEYPAGTSAVAPLYAGLIAVINANLFPNNIGTATSVGFLNPSLYQLGALQQSQGNTSVVFQDIADGGNNSFNEVATYYVSTPGWNACTGWGSINGIQLYEMLFAEIVQNNPGCVAAIQQFVRAMLGMG